MKSTLVLARLGLRFFGRSLLHLVQNQKVWIVTVILALGQVSSLATGIAPSALPTGGQITAGTGSIAQNGNLLVVQQDSAKLVANWTGFDIGSAATVRFNQPNASAIALNRVTGGTPSQILGALDANGRVFLLNPAGIVFGKTANVNVGGLVASTLSLSDADFLAGRHTFAKSGTAGSIVNQGSIAAAPGGVVAFVAPVIRNDGTLRAPGGDVALAAGDQVDVDFAGDGRLRIRIDLSAVDAEVANHGLIKADGGAVVMSAKSAANLTRAVVNNTGIVEANTVSNVNGRIVIDTGLLSNTGTLDASGTTGGSIAATAGYALNAGTISVRGTSGAGGTILVDAARNVQTSGAVFDASGSTQGGKISLLAGSGEYNGLFSSATVEARGASGGTITLAGKRIDLRGTTLDASGTTAGGSIRVGGELHGGAWTDPITGRALTNATVTDVSPDNTLKSSATQGDGTGGRIIVWSDQQTYFYGAAQARGTGSGAGGFIEVSGKDRLQYGGTVDASSASGKAGTVLFDPKNIVIDDSAGGGGMSYNAFTNPNPGADTQFGTFLVALANGNMVATDPYATAGGQTRAGAAYLFEPDGTLISTLTGSHANDEIGYDLDNWTGGTTVLTNDNYVISSPAWNGDRGAATWGSNTAGVSGIVSSGNSLVGSQAGDKVGSGGYGAYILSNGNYVISSPSWSDGATTAVGAVTWGNGASGVIGTISSANSLIGSSANDAVGGQDVTVLTGNGNYVVLSPWWDNVGLSITNAGAATWVNGATGQTSNATNTISSANSIVGDFLNDQIGIGKATALTNGNYVVSSFYWHDGAGTQVGAATWVNGATGQTSNASNTVSAANSLVGSVLYDNISSSGIFALSNGNYVVDSSNWGGGGTSSVGAVTWGNGATGIAGTVGAANSLLGSTANDSLGNGGITVLTNGNYVVLTPYWDNGATANVGAATWQDGSTAGTRLVGAVVGSANSLIGSDANTRVGSFALPLLTNGNYVVGSSQYNSGAGAATWVDGSNGHTANSTNTISAANSLIGSSSGAWNSTYNSYFGGDGVGANITALPNGNYVVSSPSWAAAKGAVTWGNGTTGVVGAISNLNSLVGSTTGTFTPGDTNFVGGDKVGSSITTLTNNNFVVASYDWSDGGLNKVGAVTWVDGTTGLTGTVSSTNSLVGATANDRVGYGGVVALDNGNFVVGSPNWDGATVDSGAATWVDGTIGLTGAVDATNSLVGTVGQKLGGFLLAGTGDTFGVGDGINLWGVGIYTVSFASSYSGGYTFADNPADLATLTSSQLTSVLNTGSNLVLQANNDITVTSAVTVNNAGGNGGALMLQAGRSILLNNSLTTDNGALTLVANEIGVAGVIDAQRDAGAAVITMAGGTSINAGTGAVSITLSDGWGKTNTTSGDITLKDITAGSLGVTNFGPTAGSDIIADGAVVVPGAITFTTLNAFTQNAAATITGGAGTVTVNSDTIALGGAANSISGSEILRLIPRTGSRPIVIGAAGTGSDFALDATELATLANGFGVVQFGQSNQTGGITLSGALSFTDYVELHNSGVGGAITLDASAHVNTNGNPITFYAGSGDAGIFTQANGATISAGGGGIYLYADSVALNGAANSISGSDQCSIYSNTASRPVILGASGGAGDLALDAAEIATLANGFSLITFMGGSGNIVVGGPLTFHDSLGLYQNAGGTFTVNAAPVITGSLVFGNFRPVTLNASVSATSGVTIYGALTVGADNLTVDAGTGTATFDSTVAHGANAFTVTADDLQLSGNWTGTGARVLQPTTVAQTIGLAGGAGIFSLDATELGYLSNGTPLSVTIGRSGGTGAIDGGAFSFDDPLFLRGGTITQTGAWMLGGTSSFAAGAGNSITLSDAANDFTGAVSIASGNNVSLTDTNALVLGASAVSGDLTLQTGGALTQSGDLSVAGTSSVTAGANHITLDRAGNDFGGAVSIVSGNNIGLRDANALTLGAVTATGTVDIATLTSDLTLSGAIATTNTAANAIQLNAGRSAAAGTAAGGSLIVSGGSVSTGAGGISTLYTGSVSGSTGLTALIGSGTGRFRYNSDETATNFTTALTAGLNAIYREQPLLGVTPDSHAITYGTTTPTFSATIGTGYVNGDASPGTVTGTATWTIGGPSSTAGYLVAGNHEIGYNTGLTSSLGYGFADNATSLNELAIVQRSLTITGLTTANRDYNGTNVATLGGTAAITVLGSDDVTLGGAVTGTFADKHFGTGKAVTVVGNTISGTDATNYTLVQQTGLTADIAKANLTVSTSDVVKTYDANTSALGTATVVSGTLNDTLSGGSFAFTNKNASSGDKTVTVSGVTISDGNSGNNYAVTYANNTTSTINPATLTVGYTGVNRVYDATTGATVTTSDNRLGSDALTINRTAAFTTKDVANGKTVNVIGVSLSGTDAGNYTVAATTGTTTANITPATLTVGYTGVNRVYDATTGATVTTSDNRLGSDVFTINRTAAFTTKDVANGKTVNVTGVALTGTDAANYTVAATGSTTANITPATLTVGYTGVNRVYDATTGATVTTSDDRLGSDVLTINRTAAFTTKDVANGKTVNVTGVSLTGTDAGNYTVATTGSTTANITPATLTVGYTGVNRVYDATTGATVSTSDNRLGTDVLTINRAAAFATKDVANGKTVNVTGVALTGTDAGNYTVAATGSTTANITPATLTVGYAGVNRVYDATTGATVTTSDDRLGSDVLTINRTAAFTTKDVASGKTVNVTGVSLSGTDAGNYTLATVTGSTTANITPATLTVSGLSAANKSYDGTTSAVLGGSGSVTALGSDSVTLGGSATAAFVDKNAGTGKAVAISGLTLSGADAGNYTIASTGSAIADITPKILTAAFTAADKVYDGTTVATATGSTLSGLVGTETVGVTNTAATFGTKDVGTGKTVTVSGIALSNGTNGGLASNYTVAATATTSATITPATLTYVANPAEAFSAVSLPVLSGTVTGFVGGETLATATTSTAVWTSNVTTGSFTGNYAINGSGLLATNYVFVQAAGNATALFLQPVNPVVTDTPRVEPFIGIDGRNQGELYPFEGGTLGLERSAVFAPLFAPAPEVIDQRGEEDDENPAVTTTTAPSAGDLDTARSAQSRAGSTPVAALLGKSGARRHID